MSEERYHAKRAAGISERRTDGSRTSAETDRQAGAAERFACERFGREFNSEIYANHGDGGHDFVMDDGRTVEVVWLGYETGTRSPRLTHGRSNLIVNPHEPWRHADLYFVVAGSIKMGFTLVGWVSHEELVARPRMNFGYGDRFAIPAAELHRFL